MPWRNQGAGDSSWMRYRHWEGKRVMSFGYDVRRILAGHQTREVIRKQALQLLDDLMSERKNDIMVRSKLELKSLPVDRANGVSLETSNLLSCA